MVRCAFAFLAIVACGSTPRAPAPAARGRLATKTEVHAVGDPAKGKIEQTEIKRVVRERFVDIRDCYLQVLKTKPSAHGGVATHFVIGEDGFVELAYSEADHESLPETMTDCVARGFLLLQFPAPTGGRVLVVYPIEFTNELGGE